MERKRVERFEDLLVWQKGITLVKQVYLACGDGQLSRDYGLRDQLQRAVVSIPTNIAEGFERQSAREYVQFLNIAKGSAGELRSLLRVALDIGYLGAQPHEELAAAREVSAYLANLIRAIRAAGEEGGKR